jgi:hypothetical protein
LDPFANRIFFQHFFTFQFVTQKQILNLRDQLDQEIRKRQMFITHSVQADGQLKTLHSALTDSLSHVAKEPLDPLLLELEARKLNDSLSGYKYMRHQSPPKRHSPSAIKSKALSKYT